MYQSFEDLKVWKRACQLAVRLYKALENCQDFGLKDQMQRAAASIASNIAEGSERHGRNFARFLGISRGSCAQLQAQLYIAARVEITSDTTMRELVGETKQISKMLYALGKSLKTENETGLSPVS